MRECYALIHATQRRRKRFPENCVRLLATEDEAQSGAISSGHLHAAVVVGPSKSSEGFRIYSILPGGWIDNYEDGNMTSTKKIIPLAPQQPIDVSMSACAGAEPYALMVLGDSMAPEFEQGEIIIIEPEGLATDGAFVLAFHNEEYIFRQLVWRAGGWCLHPLNTGYEDALIPDLSVVKGVIIQKQRQGSRRTRKTYSARHAQ